MNRIRAKFTVSSKSIYGKTDKGTTGEVMLRPVYSTDPNHENKTFWEATPTGEIKLSINNPIGFEAFELGAEYYVDFEKA